MTGQTYQVNYIVNVDAANAQSAINSFKRAVASMDKATKPITDLQRKVRGLVETMSSLNRGKYSVKIDTRPATQKIGKLIRALQMAKAEVQQLNAMGVTLGGVGNKGKTSSHTTSTVVGASQRSRTASKSSSTPASASRRYAPSAVKHPTNLGYKIWGPTPLPNNGGMAIDMMKGMGVAYGLAGAGMMVSNIVDQAAEYDNLMKTVENILKSHDTKGDFSSRFSSMTTTVRNVGMETKFKVTEVADAAKFLAMAGLNVEAISQAIRPIADIALVGDTELGETADLVTNIMTAYNIAPSKMRNAADVMTNTFTMSNTTLTEIAESYKYAASLLSAGGVPFEEATAAIGVLGDAGIKGSQAGTTLRTIIANIVNPTKKQQSAWDEIGVSRYNRDGSRKSVLEIFQALNQANLGVDAYYRLFHKTAASGAVALASHVDKWEDVYLENFLANGLSAHLANEKKNTLQGLWAQLESVFIDKGVTAFNGIQGELRNIMSSAIAWLKTDEATKKFKEISKAIMEFVRVIIQASKYFAQLFDMFGGWMKAWMKFQIMIWPVVKAVTAFRSIFLGLMGLRKVGFMIMGLSQSFRALGAAATFAGRSIAGSAVAGTAGTTGITRVAGPIGFLPGLTATQMNWARSGMSIGLPGKSLNVFGWKKIPLGYKTKGIDISRPVYDRGSYDIVGRHQENRKRLLQYQKNMRAYNRRLALHQGINGAGNIAGMFGVGYGMKTIADSNNGYDTAAGGLFTAAGTAAMMGGPWGWGIGAGLAIVGGIMKVIGSAQQSNKIYGELQVFAKKNAINSGIIADSESQTMKYLEVQHTKYRDINQLIQKRIDLTAQLLGLQNGDNPMDASVGVFQGLMEKHKDLWDSDTLKAFNDIYRDKFNTNKHLVRYGSGYYLTSSDRLVSRSTVIDGKRFYKIQGANGEEAIRVGNGTTNGLEAAFASMAATAEVMAPGGYYEKLVEGIRLNIAKYGLKNASRAEFGEYINHIIKANNPKYLTDLVGLDEIKDTDWDLNRMLRDEQTRIYMWTQLEALITPMRQAFDNFKSELESGNLSSGTLTNYLQYVIGNQAGAALKDYNPNDIMGWYSHFGYKNGAFNGFTTVDENGVVRAYTAEEAAKIAASNMQAVVDVIKQLELESDPAAEGLQTYANILLTLAQSFIGQNNAISGKAEGEIIEIHGQKWRWNATTKQWELIDDNNQPAQISQGLVDMSNNMNTLLTTVQNVNAQWPTLFPTVYPINSGWGYNSASPYNWGTDNNNLTTNGLLWNPLTNTNKEQPFSWWPSWNNGENLFTPQQTYRTTGVTMTPQQMGNAVAKSNAPGVHTPTGNNHNEGTNNGGRTGTRTSDYKSHQKERAIPKQININIQNLMKVDSIDMTNENNVAIIEKLKEKVAYALYEAAADGTMMLNGLSNT